MSERQLVVVAGATGDLGGRIAKALVARGAIVRALVRPDLNAEKRACVGSLGVTLVPADPGDLVAMAGACGGAACVVSALNGLHDVIIDRQGILLDAAVKAGVPRFIPSDFSGDFTQTRPGDNRNFDLRRKFMAHADAAPIRVTSIFNGAFMDMLGAEMPLIQRRLRRVLYWRSADQMLDFTTKDDVAAYTAAAVLDDNAPRILRIAGDIVSSRDIAAVMTAITGERYGLLWAGSIGMLGMMIGIAKLVAPQPTAVFPPWQGMQYVRDMFSGRAKLDPLHNGRYPAIGWTTVRELFAARGNSPASDLDRCRH